MSYEFDKKLMMENIAFLLKQTGKKIGELEAEAGVSIGYISRTNKDENAKPGIDFIIKVAEALDVSVDALLKVSMSDYTQTELYVMSFIEKLITDTNADKLEWIRETADRLNRQEMDSYNIEHPLFTYETYYEETEIEYPEEVSRVVFVSNAFNCHTYINGDCFKLRLKNGAYFYLMNISKSVYSASDKNAFAKEIWMCNSRREKQYLCGNKDDAVISRLVERLYESIAENTKHPKIKGDFKYAIDAYMQDDTDDDDEGNLPFT